MKRKQGRPSDPARGRIKLQIAELLVAKKTQPEIAEILGLSNAKVGHMVDELQHEWASSRHMTLDAARNKEANELDVLQRQYMDGWEESKAKGKGDPRFLNGIGAVIDRRIKLYGLDTPVRILSSDVDPEIEKLLEMIEQDHVQGIIEGTPKELSPAPPDIEDSDLPEDIL